MSIFEKGKLTKPQFVSKIVCGLLYILLFGLLNTINFPGDVGGEHGGMHTAFSFVCGILAFFYIIILFRKSLDENLEFDFAETKEGDKFYAGVGTLLTVITLVILSTNVYKDVTPLYNTHYQYVNAYTQVSQEKETYYDNMWKTYQLKNNLKDEVKVTFIEVTKILMEGRHDGQSVAWKWTQENQPVPYAEFTNFYADLSNFVETQRAGYLALEVKSQSIAKQNNTLLDTLPNRLYNKVLKLPHIEYKAGFTSAKTQKVFQTGVEEL